MISNLTKKEIESIQIDESVSIINYGEDDERPILPCRGGGEFTATVGIRDIEFDGRNGKTTDLQTIEEQEASLKLTTINMSIESLATAMPFCRIYDANGDLVSTTVDAATIKNPKMGIIESTAYFKNITTFAKTIKGTYKKIIIYNAMHEGGISAKAVQKAEGELSLEFFAHYKSSDLDGDLWEVTDVNNFTLRKTEQTEQTGQTEQTEQTGQTGQN